MEFLIGYIRSLSRVEPTAHMPVDDGIPISVTDSGESGTAGRDQVIRPGLKFVRFVGSSSRLVASYEEGSTANRPGWIVIPLIHSASLPDEGSRIRPASIVPAR